MVKKKSKANVSNNVFGEPGVIKLPETIKKEDFCNSYENVACDNRIPTIFDVKHPKYWQFVVLGSRFLLAVVSFPLFLTGVLVGLYRKVSNKFFQKGK